MAFIIVSFLQHDASTNYASQARDSHLILSIRVGQVNFQY